MKKKQVMFICSIIILILLIILGTFIIFKQNKKVSKPLNNSQPPITVQDLLKYDFNDEQIDAEFLNWISQEYGSKAIQQLNDILSNNEYTIDSWYQITGNSYIVLRDYYLHNYDNATNVTIINNGKKKITLNFVGDVSLADNWYIIPQYQKRQKGINGILSKNVVSMMEEADVMVANNEFTVSNRGSALKNKTYTFRAKPENLSIYKEMGVDLVTLANNHVYDYGGQAFLDMLDALNQYKIPHIGAGRNIAEASQPYYFIVNGKKIAFVNATRAEKYLLTPGATSTTGGVFRCYDPTNFINTIKEVKKNSDYVIALVHWGTENTYKLEKVQIETGKLYIDAGADAIVGSHAHTLQGMEFYNDKLIAYNLGNFIFNDVTKDTGILSIQIDNDGQFTYFFQPCIQKDEYVDITNDTNSKRILKDMENFSTNVTFLDNGQIIKKNEG